MHVRVARDDDLSSIVDIYNWYVINSSATFDTQPTTVEVRRSWFSRFTASGPHRLVVATDDEEHVCGYAGSVPYRDHSAFRETVELTIYTAPAWSGRGVGTQLYQRLLAADKDPQRVEGARN